MRIFIAATFFIATTFAAEAQSPDLAAMIECRSSVSDYNAFAMSFATDPEMVEGLGWKEIPTSNLMLAEYELPSTINVFQHSTRRLVFTSTGAMGVFDRAVLPDVAHLMGIAVRDEAGKVLAERILLDDRDESDGIVTTTRVSLNISTVDPHPDKVLAGCSYRVEVE